MLKRKIFVLIFVSMLFAMMLIAENAQAGFFSEIINSIKNWFSKSPLSAIFGQQKSEEVVLIFYPQKFTLNYDGSINISTQSITIYNFMGTFDINTAEGIFSFKQKNSELAFELKTDSMTIEKIKINELKLENTKLTLIYGNWNETTENGSIYMQNFIGKMTVEKDKVEMIGNTTKIVKK